MAIYRKEKKQYSIMDMDILTSKDLSWRAKSILQFCLSRPDNWVFSVRGIKYYGKDGIDSVRSGVHELEEKGHLVRRRVRNHGAYGEMIYDVYEDPSLRKPEEDEPAPGLPSEEGPLKGTGKVDNMDADNNDVHIKDDNNYQKYIDGLIEKLRQKIEYNVLAETFDSRVLDNIVSVMAEVEVNQSVTIHVSKDRSYPTDYVRDCLKKINPLHIEQILRNMERDQPSIHNVHGYLLTALINAANTMDTGYEYGEA